MKPVVSPQRSKAGLREVAREAGVSLATASRALSQPELVSDVVRERVAQASRTLHYIPNRTARRLFTSRSETIGVIVPSIGNPLFSATIDGVRSVLDQHGFSMMIESAERDARREFAQIRSLIEHGVDAILTLMPVHDAALFALRDHARLPMVFLSPGAENPPCPNVDYENQLAMSEMVTRVIAAGHRRIAVLSGPRESTPVIARRLDAVLEALAAADRTPPAHWVHECDFAPVFARAGARAILSHPDRPSALICTGDQHGVAALIEAQAMGLSIPENLSITGCNDQAIAQLCIPELSTIYIPYRELGEVACRLALDMLAGITPPSRTVIPYRFVMRGSLSPWKNQ